MDHVGDTVPVIDIGGWEHGDAAVRAEIAASVDAAFRTVGFMQIVGHGIPSDAVAGLGAASPWRSTSPGSSRAHVASS